MTTHAADDFRARNYDVFVSYKRLDADIRDLLIEALEAAGLSVWWDAKLQSGKWRPQLAERIRSSKLVVALWSEQVTKAPDEVKDEMSAARALDRLMALKTDSAAIPRVYGDGLPLVGLDPAGAMWPGLVERSFLRSAHVINFSS